MDVFGIPLYIVDGYNVVLSRSFSSDSKDIIREKERFLRAADSYRAKKRVVITVVWDGGPPPGGHGGGARVRSIYSGEGKSADDRIVGLVERSGSRGRITVVSNDRRHIRGVVKSLGAKVMTVEEFLSLIQYMSGGKKKRRAVQKPDEVKKKVADDLSVDDWIELFRSSGKKH